MNTLAHCDYTKNNTIMKTNQDYWEHALKTMADNGTLSKSGDCYYPADNVQDDIEKVLISRFSNVLNEALIEPYSKARLNDTDPKPVIDSYIEDYALEVISLCEEWVVRHSSLDEVKNQLFMNLNSRYK